MASITIPLYYDLDLLLWTSAVGGIARQPNLVLGQSDSIDFAVQFVRSGAVVELTSPQFICGIKPINDTAGDYLCLTTTVVKTGATTTTVYTFTLLLDTDELRAWLLTVTAVSNYAAFSIRDTVNLIATLPAITCTILPDYTLEGTTPTAASGTLIVASGQTFTVNKTFAMPTTDGFNNYVLKTNGAGVGSWAVDSAGTGTVQSVSVTTANGVSGTVATSTTTPAITIALGAITPTTGAFSSTTDSSSHTTGAVTIAGGLGVSKNLYVNANATFNEDATFSSDIILGGVLLARYFNSTNNLPSLQLPPVDGSVNYLAIEQSATTLPVHIYAQGTDTNIGLHLQAKGTGFVNVQDGTDTTKRLRFSASGNSNSVITTLASSSTTSQTITLPNATGATTLAGLQMTQSFTQVNTFSNSTASTSSGTGALLVTGGIGVALVTDATSSTNGGAMTIAGGLAVAKKLYVGGTLTFGGHILPSLDNAYDIGQSASPRIRDIYCVGTATMQNVKCAENVFAGNYQDLSNVIAFFKIGQDSTHSFFFTNRTASASKVVLSIGTQDATQTADLFHCYQNSVVKFAVSTTGTITLAGGVVFGSFLVSTFPATTYFEAVVTDALTPVVGSTVNAGGSAKCKVMYNGSAKIVTAVL
jgi:hypothetical protein